MIAEDMAKLADVVDHTKDKWDQVIDCIKLRAKKGIRYCEIAFLPSEIVERLEEEGFSVVKETNDDDNFQWSTVSW